MCDSEDLIGSLGIFTCIYSIVYIISIFIGCMVVLSTTDYYCIDSNSVTNYCIDWCPIDKKTGNCQDGEIAQEWVNFLIGVGICFSPFIIICLLCIPLQYRCEGR